MAVAASRSDFELDAPLRIAHLTLPNRLLLAPMSGVTDLPFRRRALESGIGLAFAEMVASGELERGRAESFRRIRSGDTGIRAVQLVGREPASMAEAARSLAEAGVDIIDINMGCPAKKVTGGACGAALMTEPDRAARIVEAVVAAAPPALVTVKMRLGWDEGSINAPALARRLVDAGARMITVHGRTREQRYSGTVDPDAIAAVRRSVPDIPFVANGDVANGQGARDLLERTGADAVMIGRAHYGQPFLAAAILGSRVGPAPKQLADYIAEHYREMLDEYGVVRGSRHARKHLGWYLDRFRPATPAALRRTIMTAPEPAESLDALAEAFASARLEEAA